MLETGHDLPDAEIVARYDRLPHVGDLGPEFRRRVFEVAGELGQARVLDVGCGRGELLAAVRRRWPTASVHGVDVSVVRIRQAPAGVRERAVAADIVRAAPFRDRSFDRVFCLETLEHLKDPRRCLREIVRLLAPGGRVILSVPNATGFSPFHRLGRLLPGRWLRGKLLPYEHPANTEQPIDTCFRFGEILDLVRASGLEVEAIHGGRYFRYLEMLPGTRRLYPWLGHVLERAMPPLGGVRFAYNLALRCRLASMHPERVRACGDGRPGPDQGVVATVR